MEKSPMKKIKADTVILREGESHHEMYKILSGKVALYLHYGQENEYLVGILSEQGCFGEICVLSDEPSIYTVVAYDDVLLLCITQDNFYDFIQNNPRNAIDIMKNMSHDLNIMKFNIKLLMEELKNGQTSENQKIQNIEQKLLEYRRNTIQSSPYLSMFSNH